MPSGLTAQRLREVLAYDPETGVFTWRQRLARRIAVGDVAGSRRRDGYIEIRVDNELHLAHRLAVLWMTGEWPIEIVDHRNGHRDHNAWLNLRRTTQGNNMQNTTVSARNKSGHRGVHFDRRRQRWMAFATINKKRHHIGYFDDREAAAIARDEFVLARVGEFACFGNGINVHGDDLQRAREARQGVEL